MTTALVVIEAGIALSALNRPETLATNAVELVRVVKRAQVALFGFCARVNPSLLLGQADVSLSGGVWARPSDADAVFRIEGRGALTTPNTTAEIKVVPWDDLAIATPAVYRAGQAYRPTGNTGDPSAGLLRMYYASRPTALAATSDVLDVRMPEEFHPIYEYEVGKYLARKDGGRPNEGGTELQMFTAEQDRWLSMFMDWCEHETMNETRRFDVPRVIVTEARETVKKAFAA